MATPEISIALAHLLRGPIHAEDQPAAWTTISTFTKQLRDHLDVLGLRLVIDDTERYAYLRAHDELPDGMPRLIRRHTLTFSSSVLLVMLRQQLATAESDGQMPRLVITGTDMVEMLRLYRHDDLTRDQINGDISVLDKLGYIRTLRGQDDTWEVRRIIKAIVTGEWINTYGQELLAAITAIEGKDESNDHGVDGDDARDGAPADAALPEASAPKGA
ncbi:MULTISPECIES: DUF4194 domain-containing protein [unclassified Nocardioides]|uniref:DUF4194 domain-containing protein n=1 Tax=unclassified Nocardioides TaxID=2615069 RepID=UPI000701D637|nr:MULTISPECIES: DUF4194 domain-containing protein [unclassified Nocardioides]KRA30033.1 hypothetical protein ASD81_20300 [Nocardioides sp. Root614]KRA86953.1 hypothetical protein ASD84_22515 [Nocardioides sp. Root682]